MATNTYVALDKSTVTGSAVPSVTFSNISSAYTDLVIVTNLKGTASSETRMQVGGTSADTGSNYMGVWLSGTGSTGASGKYASTDHIKCNSYSDVSTTFGQVQIINIMNYASTSNWRSVALRSSNAANGVDVHHAVWKNSTTAIGTIKLYPATGSYDVGSTFTLYGIKTWSTEVSTKATGGYVYSDTNYWYHAFPFSSTFTPNESITADALIIAGGGGAGNIFGGGGAGGVRTITSTSLTATSYTITVGAGGQGGASSFTVPLNGSNGVDSTAFGITSTGGGGGGVQSVGAAGGSGGGGGGWAAGAYAGGSGTSGQGNAGGAGGGGDGFGGGGGGAGAAGATAVTGLPGVGGAGTATYSSWASATKTGLAGYYAGGGGGGAYFGNTVTTAIGALGGLGGGGNGGLTQPSSGSAGVSNTGSGGGAGTRLGTAVSGGAGGSGLVIIRYAK